MASTDNIQAEMRDQLRQLQNQVQGLMSDRVTPTLRDAASRARDFADQARGTARDYASTARDYASQARDYTADGAEAVSDRVRDQPLLAVAVAAGVGYLLGRITR